MSTRDVIGVVGAGVGFLIGGPLGAAALGATIGFTVGGIVGNLVDPVTIKAPGLSEAPSQTSNDGVPRPKVWGLHGGIHGNILQKNPETQVTTTESQGKGGGPEVEETRRYRTFAIRGGEGPISEITRIWKNGTLVYDVRDTPAIPVAETEKFAEDLRIYLGDESQLPDSELESYWGEDTPAYRGTWYIVLVNHDLTDVGGAIPQFAFEINASRDATITSQPYPIEQLDGILPDPVPQSFIDYLAPIDGVNAAIATISWTIDNVFEGYTYETEGIDASIAPQSWAIENVYLSYDYEVEGIDATVTPQSWEISPVLISYNYAPEGVNAGIAPLSWTIT